MNKLIYVTAISLMFTLFSCNQTTNNDKLSTDLVNNPNSADGTNSESLPIMKFENDLEIHDFGKILQGEKVTHFFKFKNTGKSDLIISSATASCGCTVPSYPKNPIKAGESGEIEVTFNSEGRKGNVTKTVTVLSNTQPSTKVLTIKAEIIVP